MPLPATLGRFLAILSSGFLMAIGGQARSAEKAGPAQAIRIECQMVILPQAEFQQVLPLLQDKKRVEEGWTQVSAWMKSGTAQLASLLSTPALVGDRFQVETVEEIRYATEFEPPATPTVFGNESVNSFKHWPFAGTPPTSFETRNIGTTLEVEIAAEADGFLVNVVPVHVRFLRFAKTEAFRLPNGEQVFIEQPIFHTMKNQTRFRAAPGERVLVGTHRVPGSDKPSYELFMMRLTTE